MEGHERGHFCFIDMNAKNVNATTTKNDSLKLLANYELFIAISSQYWVCENLVNLTNESTLPLLVRPVGELLLS